jgi:hypothetical protein
MFALTQSLVKGARVTESLGNLKSLQRCNLEEGRGRRHVNANMKPLAYRRALMRSAT